MTKKNKPKAKPKLPKAFWGLLKKAVQPLRNDINGIKDDMKEMEDKLNRRIDTINENMQEQFAQLRKDVADDIKTLVQIMKMKIKMCLFVVLFLTVCTSSSAARYKLSFGQQITRVSRAHNVGYGILRDNVELAKDGRRGTRYDVGIYLMTGINFPYYLREMINRDFNIGDGLTIVSVLKYSPADMANLLVWDKIVSVNGYMFIGNPLTSFKEYNAAINKFNSLVNESTKKNGSVAITVERGGLDETFNIVPDLICNAKLHVVLSNDFRAFVTPPRNIVISLGAINHLKNDAELALVLGHELAHITRLHAGKRKAGALVGTAVGMGIAQATGIYATGITSRLGGLAFSHKYELEADYLGLYHTARVGYNVNKAVEFFRSNAGKTSVGGFRGSLTHPNNVRRFLKLNEAIDEIKRKQANGQDLIPN